MTAEEAAEELHGRFYRKENLDGIFNRMKDSGIVVVFGASDDLMEFDGALYDEFGCYDGGKFYFHDDGRLDETESARWWIEAVWAKGDVSWSYNTNIPCHRFTIFEDHRDGSVDKYCVGFTFGLSVLKS